MGSVWRLSDRGDSVCADVNLKNPAKTISGWAIQTERANMVAPLVIFRNEANRVYDVGELISQIESKPFETTLGTHVQ